jgi:hypothetical protein
MEANIHLVQHGAIGILPRLIIVLWTKAPSLNDAQEMAAALDREAARGAPIFMLAVIDAAIKPPQHETRAFAASMFRKLGPRLGAVAATSTPLNAFLATVIRAVMSGVVTLARIDTDIRYCGGVYDGIAWLQKKAAAAGVTFDAVEVAAVVAEMRDQLRARQARATRATGS